MPTPNYPDLATPMPGGDGSSPMQKAAAAVDDKRDAVASGLQSAAETLREKAERMPGGERIAGAANTAADAMESAAGYVRDTDVNEMLADLRQMIKNHPGATLLTAAALGFLLVRKLARH